MGILEIMLWIIFILVTIASLANFNNSIEKKAKMCLSRREFNALKNSLIVYFVPAALLIFYHSRIILFITIVIFTTAVITIRSRGWKEQI